MKKVVASLVPLVKYLKWIPNALTLGNSLCGFAAILFTLQVYDPGNAETVSSIFAFSAFMIICAMVFDAFDGYAARLLNAASLHGIQMDSLADMVTFGVAPATEEDKVNGLTRAGGKQFASNAGRKPDRYTGSLIRKYMFQSGKTDLKSKSIKQI